MARRPSSPGVFVLRRLQPLDQRLASLGKALAPMDRPPAAAAEKGCPGSHARVDEVVPHIHVRAKPAAPLRGRGRLVHLPRRETAQRERHAQQRRVGLSRPRKVAVGRRRHPAPHEAAQPGERSMLSGESGGGAFHTAASDAASALAAYLGAALPPRAATIAVLAGGPSRAKSGRHDTRGGPIRQTEEEPAVGTNFESGRHKLSERGQFAKLQTQPRQFCGREKPLPPQTGGSGLGGSRWPM
mmetsp:Transcript_10954/g.32163  ORF Transcript_10954/g.32163 Transcript_10954/m.32163 type:complete len:242 (+) Transcript_10954:614-1339(+)